MPPVDARLYRHDSVNPGRPYGLVDVDDDGWLWRSAAGGRLMAHNLRTAELRVLDVPPMRGHKAFSVFCWHGRIVALLGEAPYYLVVDPDSGRAEQHPAPTERPVLWYGTQLPGDRLLLCHRGGRGWRGGQAWVLDAPGAAPRVVPFPYRGDFNMTWVEEDGLAYVFLADPARVVRFDPATERFLDESPIPWPDVLVAGRLSHRGTLYCADSSGGRLLPLDLRTQKWLDPIPHPDYRKTFGFIAMGFRVGGVFYFTLSNYAHRSRLDLDTGEIILPPPEVPMTVDGEPERFLERLIAFDPAAGRFTGYLTAPPQPDGVAVLCYTWSDGTDFAVTGTLMRNDDPNACGDDPGPWVVLQGSSPRSSNS